MEEKKTFILENRKKIIIFILFLLFVISLFIGYNYKNNIITDKDKLNVTEKYLSDLNLRLKKYGVNENITKFDFEILDGIIKNNLFNFSNKNQLLKNQTKEDGGMIGFSQREQMLFLPQISTIRKMCKLDINYCNTILEK